MEIETQTSKKLLVAKVSKTFHNSDSSKLCLYSEFEITIYKDDITCLYGANGSGKTSLLNILLGRIPNDSGYLNFYKEELKKGAVFQNYAEALHPWLNVKDNISFPLKAKNSNTDLVNSSIVEEIIEVFDLEHLINKYPKELSGGQKQMIAIARILVYCPSFLVLDEPFASLDYIKSRHYWTKLRDYCKSNGITTVLVSHEIDGGIFMSDRIITLKGNPVYIGIDKRITFPSKRDKGLTQSKAFFELRNSILGSLEYGNEKE